VSSGMRPAGTAWAGRDRRAAVYICIYNTYFIDRQSSWTRPARTRCQNHSARTELTRCGSFPRARGTGNQAWREPTQSACVVSPASRHASGITANSPAGRGKVGGSKISYNAATNAVAASRQPSQNSSGRKRGCDPAGGRPWWPANARHTNRGIVWPGYPLGPNRPSGGSEMSRHALIMGWKG
jgi:hypothetical protein